MEKNSIKRKIISQNLQMNILPLTKVNKVEKKAELNIPKKLTKLISLISKFKKIKSQKKNIKDLKYII